MFHTLFYDPLYNALVYLIGVIPGGDAGIAVVTLTIIVSFILFGISKNAIRSQIKLKQIDPELKALKEKYPDRQEQALHMMELYKRHKINPISMIFLMLIQFPIIFALYFVFLRGGLPTIHTELLYSFVKVPETVSMHFLGLLDISEKSLVMAVIAGVTQFVQAQIAAPKTKKPTAESSFSENFSHSMGIQMKYVFPILIGFIGVTLPSALPLYWSVRNVFMTFQEIYVKRNIRKE